MRAAGIDRLERVKSACLERNGKVSIVVRR